MGNNSESDKDIHSDNSKENYHDSDGKFLKFLYVCVFYLIYSVSDIVLLCIGILQTLLNVFTGEPSATLTAFGESLGEYVRQISVYVSYGNISKPFPFSDWPEPSSSSSDTPL